MFPRRPRAWTAVLVAALAGALAAGCGGSSGGNADADPAKVAPVSTALYASAVVRPDGAQKDAVDAIIKKFGVGDPGSSIERSLDRSLKRSESGRVNFKDDVKPWLGKRAAFALINVSAARPDYAVVLASKDNGKARDALDKLEKGRRVQKRSYKGVEYTLVGSGRSNAQGLVGDFVVGATENGFKAVVDASKGDSLADAATFKEVKQRGDGKLAFLFADVKGTISSLASSGRLGSQGQGLNALLGGATIKPVTATLDAQSNKITVEAAANLTGQGTSLAAQTPLLAGLPGDAWAAAGLGNVGASAKQLVNQIGSGLGGAVVASVKNQLRSRYGLDIDRDVFAAIGDTAAFVRGTGALTVGGGLVIQSPDPAAARRLVTKLGALIVQQSRGSGLKLSAASVGGASGVKVTGPRFPGAINGVIKGNKLVIAYGNPATNDALNPKTKLGDAGGFKAARNALGGATPTLYVAFAPILSLADSTSSNSARYRRSRRYLAALDTLAAGSRREGALQIARLVLTLN